MGRSNESENDMSSALIWITVFVMYILIVALPSIWLLLWVIQLALSWFGPIGILVLLVMAIGMGDK